MSKKGAVKTGTPRAPQNPANITPCPVRRMSVGTPFPAYPRGGLPTLTKRMSQAFSPRAKFG